MISEGHTFDIDSKDASFRLILEGSLLLSTELSQYHEVEYQNELSIPLEVAEKLGYYVYLYIDPRKDQIFYVGKGQGRRVLAHLYEEGESRKIATISELRALGIEPRIDILAHALPNEETALRIEAAIIDLFGLGELTNAIRGWHSVQLGRIPLRELITYYAAKPVEVMVPVIMFRINNLYRHNMSGLELYEATRGVWKLSSRRNGANFAFAVFEGVVRAVYEIRAWYPAGTIPYASREIEKMPCEHRWEFVGEEADLAIREYYVSGSVAKYFKKGSQSSFTYVNC